MSKIQKAFAQSSIVNHCARAGLSPQTRATMAVLDAQKASEPNIGEAV
jgi:hypothetical protein